MSTLRVVLEQLRQLLLQSRHVLGDVRYAMLPTSTRPLWGIEFDPERPDEHVALRFYRAQDAVDRQRFLGMLLGR